MIPSNSTKVIYVGNGETVEFPFTFKYDRKEDIKADIFNIEEQTQSTITSDFYVDTVRGVFIYPGYAPGQEISESERPPVLTSNEKIIIYRSTPITQEQDLGEKYPLTIIEKMVDKNNLISQELSEQIGRCVIVESGSDTSPAELIAELRENTATAVQSASAASTSATAAAGSATSASTSATAAANSANAAAASETAAAGSASAAAASEIAAAGSATSASQSATAAAASQAAAATSETNAAGSASAAAASETAAAGSATSASQSATAAAASKNLAEIAAALAEEFAKKAAGLPVGVIIAYAADGDLPVGFLECDHAEVSRTMFADLYGKIGTKYGAGDGSTTFNLPSVNDAKRFLQGDTVAGIEKEAGLPNIEGRDGLALNSSGSGDQTGHPQNFLSGAFYQEDSIPTGKYTMTPSSWGENKGINFDASLSNPIYGNSTTVQPNALTVRYIIKAFDGQTADSAMIDITQYGQELATKANRQLSNLDTANLACHVVVDSYYNENTGDWYRVYDDGWTEQGGALGDGSAQSYVTVTKTLLKPYADSSYSVVAMQGYTATNSYTLGMGGKTTTTVTFSKVLNNGSIAGSWVAYGMGVTA